MSSEKRSISAPKELFAKADARQKQLNYPKFSDYIQALIRADTLSDAHFKMHDQPPTYTPGATTTPSSKSDPAVGQLAAQIVSDELHPAPRRKRTRKPKPQ